MKRKSRVAHVTLAFAAIVLADCSRLDLEEAEKEESASVAVYVKSSNSKAVERFTTSTAPLLQWDRTVCGQASHFTSDDKSYPCGIENTTVSAFFGHGFNDPYLGPYWSAFGGDVYLSSVRAGDEYLRYLFLFACNLMSSGRATRETEGVFRWWANTSQEESEGPMAPGLRLACAGAGSVPFFEEIPYTRLGETLERLPVSDSFILSVRQGGESHCIGRGTKDLSRSTLYDLGFDKDPPPNESSCYHYQYLTKDRALTDGDDLKAAVHVVFGQGKGRDISAGALPLSSPNFRLDTGYLGEVHAQFEDICPNPSFDNWGFLSCVIREAGSNRSARLFFHPASGAVRIVREWGKSLPWKDSGEWLDQAGSIQFFRSILAQLDLEDKYGGFDGSKFSKWVQAFCSGEVFPDSLVGTIESVDSYETDFVGKASTYQIKRSVSGPIIEFGLGSMGSPVFLAIQSARKVDSPIPVSEKRRTLGEARKEAWMRVSEAVSRPKSEVEMIFELRQDADLLYWEAPFYCEQQEMPLVYRFDFRAVPERSEYGSLEIVVPADPEVTVPTCELIDLSGV